jgi:O-antigen ligase
LNLRHPITPRSLGFDRERPLESISFFLLIVFVASAPLQWGAVLPSGQLRIEVFAFVIAALALWSGRIERHLEIGALPLVFLTGLAILGVIQLIPLPETLLAVLSPRSAEVYADTNRILQSWNEPALRGRISIAPAATRFATLFVAALACLGASCLHLLSTRSRRRTFLAALLGSAVVQTMIAVSTFGPRTTGRIAGPFINPNHFAGYLEVVLACALAVLWREVLLSRERSRGSRDRGERIERRLLPISLAALLVGVVGVGIGLTRSRGGVAAATLMVIIFVTFALSHRRIQRRTRAAMLGVLMLALAVGFIVATAKREPVLRYLESDPREIAADTRVALWKTSLDAWREYPILGAGLGAYREAYRPHQPREIQALVEQAHSDPIQMLVTGGLLGLLLSAGVAITSLALLIRQFYRQSHREESAFVLAGIGAIVVIALHGLVEFNLSIPAIPATLACVVGFSLAAGTWDGSRTSES